MSSVPIAIGRDVRGGLRVKKLNNKKAASRGLFYLNFHSEMSALAMGSFQTTVAVFPLGI